MNKETYFIRHNFKEKEYDGILEKFIKENIIAIHFENKKSTSPIDYVEKSARIAMQTFNNLAKNGGYIFAKYKIKDKIRYILGEVKKNTIIISKNYPTTVKNIYKTIVYEKIREVDVTKFQVFLAIQPQGTIRAWPSAKKLINNLANYGKLPNNIDSLHPSLVEILCYEYMKENNLIDKLTIPIGRSMMDIDIAGINNKYKRVFAQVTHSGNLVKKMKLLEKYCEDRNNVVFIFCKYPQKIKINKYKVDVISINEVYKFFQMKKYKKYLEMLLGK